MTTLPPLPEPGGGQSIDDRRTIARRFLSEAVAELRGGNRLQAGERVWDAMAHTLKGIAEQRGWKHESHRQVENIGLQIATECQDSDLAEAILDTYHQGHKNFYENQRSAETIRELIGIVERELPKLESLYLAPPRPFTIESNHQLRRLMALTGNEALQLGDHSPVGFSLRHHPPQA